MFMNKNFIKFSLTILPFYGIITSSQKLNTMSTSDGEITKERWPEYYDYQHSRTDKESLLLAEENWALEAPADLCYDTTFSILFFIVITFIGITFGTYAIVLFMKRRNSLYYGFDILYTLLFSAAFIK